MHVSFSPTVRRPKMLGAGRLVAALVAHARLALAPLLSSMSCAVPSFSEQRPNVDCGIRFPVPCCGRGRRFVESGGATNGTMEWLEDAYHDVNCLRAVT